MAGGEADGVKLRPGDDELDLAGSVGAERVVITGRCGCDSKVSEIQRAGIIEERVSAGRKAGRG